MPEINEQFVEDMADQYLLSPDFFDNIIKEFEKKIVGEKATCEVIFLCMNGRLVENAKLTSYNLIVNDETGAGKDWVVSNIGNILPKKVYETRTRITEKALNYWHNAELEPEWTWDGTVIYFEDTSQRILNCDVMKVFASSGSKATIVIDGKPKDLIVNGKPILIHTLASSTPSKDNVRRYGLVNLDTSIKQTEAIMERQAQMEENGLTDEYDPAITKALRKLRRIKVKIPYAKKIVKFMPKNIIMRTQFKRFLDLMKSSTALHQYQREQDENGFYLATEQDYNIAKRCMKKLTTNPLMIPLTKEQQRLLDTIKKLQKESKAMEYDGKKLGKWAELPDIVDAINYRGRSWVYVNVNKLAEYGFLNKSRLLTEDKTATVQIRQLQPLTLPSWDELQ